MLLSLRVSLFGKSDDLIGLSSTFRMLHTIIYAAARRTYPNNTSILVFARIDFGYTHTSMEVDVENLFDLLGQFTRVRVTQTSLFVII